MILQTIKYKNTQWDESLPSLDSENTLVLVFASPKYIDFKKPIEELKNFYKKAKILGCSSAGEIIGAQILDDSLCVAVIKFEKTEIKSCKTEIQNAEDSFSAGKKIVNELNADNLRGIFVLSDGLNVNGSELVKGLNSKQLENVVITGGLAGDGSVFKNTWSIYDGDIFTKSIIAVGFYGDHIRIGHGSRGGWDIFGPERRITRSSSNILYELDGQPALELYKKYLGERASNLPATGLLYPLAIRKNSEDNNQIVRTILGVDEKEQSLTFAGDMPLNYLAQLMRANFDHIITAADEVGDIASKSLPKRNSENGNSLLAIAVSCVGRRLLLGERSEEETEATLSSLPAGTSQIGFYSYGEISPYTTGTCDLHNQTMTLTTICETD